MKLLNWAAGLSVAAGILHGAIVEEHLNESIYVGGFFIIAAMAQGIFGFAILASQLMNGTTIAQRWPPSALRAWYVAGIVGNLFLVALYLASRTVGVAGEIEPWTFFGAFVKLLEVGIVVLLAILLARSRPSPDAVATTKPA